MHISDFKPDRVCMLNIGHKVPPGSLVAIVNDPDQVTCEICRDAIAQRAPLIIRITREVASWRESRSPDSEQAASTVKASARWFVTAWEASGDGYRRYRSGSFRGQGRTLAEAIADWRLWMRLEPCAPVAR